MRETPADKLRALIWSLLLHLAAFAIMWGGLWWTRTTAPPQAAGEPIEAVLITDAGALPPRATARPQPPKPTPRPQPAQPPPQPVAQEPPPRPDTLDQERAARLALQQTHERAEREQEQRRRQEQIDLTERRRKEEAERRQRELAEIRSQREAAERQAKLEQQRLEQLRDHQVAKAPAPSVAPAPARAGAGGADESLLAQYKFAIQQTAHRNWNRPDNVRRGATCLIRVTQIPGGEVVGHEFLNCPFDPVGRESVERAIYREPLPYTGYEKVFSRLVEIPFCYPAEECSP